MKYQKQRHRLEYTANQLFEKPTKQSGKFGSSCIACLKEAMALGMFPAS